MNWNKERYQLIFMTTMLVFVFPLGQRIMEVYNEVIADIKCYILCFSWWFLSITVLTKHFKQLCYIYVTIGPMRYNSLQWGYI